MRHTPGDWIVWGGTTFGHPDNQYNFGVKSSNGSTIARMFGPRGIRGCTDYAPPQEEVEGNAHLMAAAPKLQEELRLLVTYVQQELIPNVREIVGGQEVLDKGWERVGEGHSALALAEPKKGTDDANQTTKP